MRMLQYQLQLVDHGYVVVSGPIYDPDALRGWEKCLPIKATVIQCRNYEFQEIDFTDVILKDGDWGDEQTSVKKKFHENCRDIILGKDPDWYLYSFEVTGEALILDFYNPKEDDTNYIIFDVTDGKVYNLDIQFDVPHHSGRPNTHYEVSLSGSYRSTTPVKVIKFTTTITEYHADNRRELELYYDSSKPNTRKYADVTEYVDL